MNISPAAFNRLRSISACWTPIEADGNWQRLRDLGLLVILRDDRQRPIAHLTAAGLRAIGHRPKPQAVAA